MDELLGKLGKLPKTSKRRESGSHWLLQGPPPRWRLSTEAGSRWQTPDKLSTTMKASRDIPTPNSISTFPSCPKGPESQIWCFRVIVSYPRRRSRRLASQSAAGRLTGQPPVAPHFGGPCPPSSADRREQGPNHLWKRSRRFKKQAHFKCHFIYRRTEADSVSGVHGRHGTHVLPVSSPFEEDSLKMDDSFQPRP